MSAIFTFMHFFMVNKSMYDFFKSIRSVVTRHLKSNDIMISQRPEIQGSSRSRVKS